MKSRVNTSPNILKDEGFYLSGNRKIHLIQETHQLRRRRITVHVKKAYATIITY